MAATCDKGTCPGGLVLLQGWRQGLLPVPGHSPASMRSGGTKGHRFLKVVSGTTCGSCYCGQRQSLTSLGRATWSSGARNRATGSGAALQPPKLQGDRGREQQDCLGPTPASLVRRDAGTHPAPHAVSKTALWLSTFQPFPHRPRRGQEWMPHLTKACRIPPSEVLLASRGATAGVRSLCLSHSRGVSSK